MVGPALTLFSDLRRSDFLEGLSGSYVAEYISGESMT
jgi:hypothetical protein